MSVCRPIFIALIAAANVGAQLIGGSITGTLQDSSGAVIAGVNISARNIGTGISAAAESNGAGVYRFSALDPGVYEVEYRKQGLQPMRVERVEVGTAQEVVLNETLAIASVATDITIVGLTHAVELSKATPTLERRFGPVLLAGLPLGVVGYQFWDLTLLAPNAVRVSDGIESRRISINGQRRISTNFTINGVDSNEFFLGIPSQYPTREEIAEVQVQTSAYSAEFGRNSAQLSVITRSGGNQFHGEAWDYYGGSALRATALADKRAGFGSIRSVTNYYGAALGGPVIRNRTFFFSTAHVEQSRDGTNVRAATPVNIPTPAGFAALSTAPLGPGQSAASRSAVLGALGFLPEIHAQIRRYESVRGVNINGVVIETGAARIPFENATDQPTASLRLDHQITARDSLTLRLYGAQLFVPNTAAFATNLSFGSRFSTSQFMKGRNYALSHARIFSPHVTNEARIAYNYYDIDYRSKTEDTSTTVGTLFVLGPSFLAPSRTTTATTQFQDVVAWLAGRHSLKAGIDLRGLRFFQILANAKRGAWVFNNLADFLNNQAVNLRRFAGTPDFETHAPARHFFVQDDFKATPHLVLNIGLRYETSPVPFGFFGATDANVAAAGVPGKVRPDRNNFAPRAGFAYSPGMKKGRLGSLPGDGQTVFRGGFGIAYNTLFQQIIDTRNNYPRAQVLNTFPPNTFHLYPSVAPGPTGNLVLDPGAAFTNLPADAQNPTTHFYSLSLQRQFGRDYMAEAGYSGSRAYHLTRRRDANGAVLTPEQARQVIAGDAIPALQERRVNPRWGSRAIVDPAASSYYNSIFIRLDRKFTNGLLFGGNYTYSSNLTENDDEPPQNYSCFRCDYARSNLDRPHRGVVHYVYALPWFARSPRRMKYAFDGWQITGVTEWQSGQPFTIVTGVDSLGSGVTALAPGAPGLFPVATARPDYNARGAYQLDPVTGDWRSFRTPLDGTGLFITPRRADGSILANSMPSGGNLGRNTFRGPSFFNTNVSLMKSFAITERVRLDLRSEWTNVFNHRNFGPPVSDMNNPDFGRNIGSPVGRAGLLVAKLRF